VPDAPSKVFRHLGESEAFRGWAIQVVRAEFAAPDGTHFSRDIVRHPGAVAVVPVTAQGTALLVRQYRGSVDRYVLEIPAGTRDLDGEPPERTARRELAEEVGVLAEHLELLGEVFNTPGFCDQRTFLFLATGLSPCPTDRQGPEEIDMQVVEVPLDAPESWLHGGEVVDAQTVLGLLLARDALRER
jgi:ADP-ribose pyrophosphatase